MTRWQIFVERRWRCVRDITVAMMYGAILRVETPSGIVTAGRGNIYDWRTVRSGDLVCGPDAPDALVAIALTAEFDVPRLRLALRRARVVLQLQGR